MQRALLLLLVSASYLLFAGAIRWTLGPLLALAAVTVLVAPRRTFWFPQQWRALDWSLLALLAAITLQITPLPGWLVSFLSPHARALQTSVQLQVPGAAVGWQTLSLNSDATLESLATVALGVISFLIARALFSTGGSTRQFCRVLAIVGAVVAISALVLRAMAPGLVLGILTPSARSANPFGAFVNRNHFAGWLLLVATPVCGYLIAHLRIHPSYRDRWRIGFRGFLASGAFMTAAAALTIVGVLFLTLSRSAVAGLGAAAICGWRLGRPRVRIERTSLPTILALAGVVLLAVVLFVDRDGWSTRVQESMGAPSGDRDRITIWTETLPVVRDFWVTGTGAGTFADAMLRYQQSRVWVAAMSRWALFNNAHSHYLQVAAEGGLLLVVPTLSALFFLWRVGRRAILDDRGEMFWARVGAAAGLAGMAVQSIWETSLIMPANAVLCGVVAGLMVYQRRGSSQDPTTDHGPPLTRRSESR